MIKFTLLLIIPTFLFAASPVKDAAKHRANVAILHAVIAKKDQSQLAASIAEIGQEALALGFDCSAYTYSSYDYSSLPLWEGGRIPLTFFVYIWPPEGAVPKNTQSHASPIHSHPISCALTPLSGSITQITYQPLAGMRAKALHEERLFPGDAEIDTASDEFVHQLVCKEKGKKPAVTLHAYGAGSAEQVSAIFHSTWEECVYSKAN